MSTTSTKRPYYRRSRDGCSTCRIRRVKCDENKPQCNRCISAGHKCDGYPQLPSRASHSENAFAAAKLSDFNKPSASSSHAARMLPAQDAIAEIKVALPRTNIDEVRSYRFFLEVAAPRLAGAFDGDFWMSEIPRACFVDQAVWHAVVSLGAVYESFLARSRGTDVIPAIQQEKDFTLQQCNLAIRSLTSSPYLKSEQWRALTASILFTYICSLQNLHDQAFMHLTAGHKIIEAMLVDSRQKRLSPGLPATAEPSTNEGSGVFAPSENIPISLATLQAIIANLESHRQAMDQGGLNYEKTKNHSFNMWLFYRGPSPHSSRSGTQYATRSHMINANSAAESLIYGLLLFSQENSDRFAAVVGTGDTASLEALISGQEPYRRSFTKLQEFARACSIEVKAHTDIGGDNMSIFKALLSLQLLLVTVRLLLLRKPEKPGTLVDSSYMGTQFEEIVCLAQQVLQIDSDTASSIPTPSAMQPLFLVAHSGFPQSIRRRAISLLRAYPRCAGVWDTAFAAALADMMMKHEKLVVGVKDSGPSESDRGLNDDEQVVGLLDRIYRYRVTFQAGRQAIIAMRTWRDFLGNLPETNLSLTW
ncbi:hypothetical protein F4777DRAFT_436879 [Nemania sp. FL0916]|nr:hypothetical protein F4777DRAFT_436879 [Nemania sp. FL0916]